MLRPAKLEGVIENELPQGMFDEFLHWSKVVRVKAIDHVYVQRNTNDVSRSVHQRVSVLRARGCGTPPESTWKREYFYCLEGEYVDKTQRRF